MRFLPGAIASLLVAIALGWAKYGGHKDPKPPDAFLDSEVTLGDEARTGSCYSLRLLLRQHLLWTPGAVASWEPIGDDDWMFHVEWVEGNNGGPDSQWEKITLRKANGMVYPQVIETKANGNEPLEPFMKELMSWPQQQRAQKVERCRAATPAN